MHTREQSLGTCPRCGAAVPRRRLLIEYRRGGEAAAYAECGRCEAVVRPESA